MKYLFLSLFVFFGINLSLGQTIIDFESVGLPADSGLNGSDLAGGFQVQDLFLPNSYNAMFDSWSGWAISTKTDTVNSFPNDLSAISGSGNNASLTYGVSYAFSPSVLKLTGSLAGKQVLGMYVNNSTWATNSMRGINIFDPIEKFGGENGDRADFFLLTIKKYLNGVLGEDSVDFYLADYRFEDNDQDYIVTDWTFVDLSSLGDVDSLWFKMTTTAENMFGALTPTYFCVDDISISNFTTEVDPEVLAQIRVFPNPVQEVVQVKGLGSGSYTLRLRNAYGQLLATIEGQGDKAQLPVGHLPRGYYVLEIDTQQYRISRTIMKR